MWSEGEPASTREKEARRENQNDQGFLKLPEDVQAKLLSRLGTLQLKTARMTCKYFRLASIPCITKLHVDGHHITLDECTLQHCLKRLSMEGAIFTTTQLRDMLVPMKQLQRLTVKDGWEGDVPELDSLLASLPEITYVKLDFAREPSPPFRSFHPSGIASLRKLYLHLLPSKMDDVLRLRAVLTVLVGLTLLFEDPLVCRNFFTTLPQMPCLRELDLMVELVLYLEETAGQGNLQFLSAEFLVMLPQLKDLDLYDVLALNRWNHDVRYLSKLTALTRLCLKLYEADAPPLSHIKVQPLTNLTRLEVLSAEGQLGVAIASPQFQKALAGERHKMGLPCTRILEHNRSQVTTSE
eukprot:jgi/Botrbrau1/4503/Bobra.0220s0036.1